MKKYKVTKAMRLNSGLVKLNDDQAARRAHAIKNVDESLYEIVKPISFKIGEVFEYDGGVNGALAQCLEDPETGEPIANKKKNKPVTTDVVTDVVSLLDNKVEDIVTELSDLSVDELNLLFDAELNGKKRIGVTTAIGDELENRLADTDDDHQE